MDIKTSFMVSADTDAAFIADNPRQPERWPGFSCLNLDLEKMADLLALIRQQSVDEQLLRDFEVLHQSTVDGPWVIRLPGGMVELLAGWDENMCVSQAARWGALPCFNGAGWEVSDLHVALSHLGKLAVLALARQHSVVLHQAVEGERINFS